MPKSLYDSPEFRAEKKKAYPAHKAPFVRRNLSILRSQKKKDKSSGRITKKGGNRGGNGKESRNAACFLSSQPAGGRSGLEETDFITGTTMVVQKKATRRKNPKISGTNKGRNWSTHQKKERGESSKIGKGSLVHVAGGEKPIAFSRKMRQWPT